MYVEQLFVEYTIGNYFINLIEYAEKHISNYFFYIHMKAVAILRNAKEEGGRDGLEGLRFATLNIKNILIF